jgi:Protein of unknown function DUF262
MSRLPDRLLQGRQRLMPIEVLLREPLLPPREGERTLLCWVLPPWQRPEVWSNERKVAYIEGIFLGFGTGTYVVHESDWAEDGAKPMSGWLIDGQQRMTAIRDFVQDNLTIFDGLRFSSLSVADQRIRFLSVVFPSVELEYRPDEQRLKEIYLRMNFGGVPHTEQDLQRLRANPDSPNGIDEQKLANRFVELLVQELGASTFQEVVEHNAAETNPSVCHSHDFCDANMVMVVAWHETVGRHFEAESERQTAIWSKAWDLAKELMPKHLELLKAGSRQRQG